jgi:hypothetical protein
MYISTSFAGQRPVSQKRIVDAALLHHVRQSSRAAKAAETHDFGQQQSSTPLHAQPRPTSLLQQQPLSEPLSTDNAAAAATAAAAAAASPLAMRGQCKQARRSVELAIEKQHPPPGGDELWGGHQATTTQAEKESDNVRALLRADGMPEWRADSARLPPPRPANASIEHLLEHVAVGGTAWLAFGNSGVTEMLLNWAHHVIRLGFGFQMVVAAFDEPLLLELHRQARNRSASARTLPEPSSLHPPSAPSQCIPAYNYSGALPSRHFRHAPHLFHRMGFLKAELIVHVLQTGAHLLCLFCAFRCISPAAHRASERSHHVTTAFPPSCHMQSQCKLPRNRRVTTM